MSLAGINSYKVQELKNQLGIETQLTIHYTTYASGSNRIIEKGRITQDACGDLKKQIINVMTGSIGWTEIRLIYTDWTTKEPTIKRIRYEHTKA